MHHDLVEIVKDYLPLLNEIDQVYLFGSVLSESKTPGDIDVLLIYSKYNCTMYRQAKEFAKQIKITSGLDVDLTILSTEEESEIHFSIRANALQIK